MSLAGLLGCGAPPPPVVSIAVAEGGSALEATALLPTTAGPAVLVVTVDGFGWGDEVISLGGGVNPAMFALTERVRSEVQPAGARGVLLAVDPAAEVEVVERVAAAVIDLGLEPYVWVAGPAGSPVKPGAPLGGRAVVRVPPGGVPAISSGAFGCAILVVDPAASWSDTVSALEALSRAGSRRTHLQTAALGLPSTAAAARDRAKVPRPEVGDVVSVFPLRRPRDGGPPCAQ